MSAFIIAFKDFPFITLLNIATIVSNTGSPSIINGATITIKVYVFATPKIDITDNEYPKKLEPASPIKVFAGLKLNGRKPLSAPASAVINKIAIIGEPFKANIISIDIHDINAIPEDNPSNPSIKLIAFVTPMIHPIVNITENAFGSPTLQKNGIFTF